MPTWRGISHTAPLSQRGRTSRATRRKSARSGSRWSDAGFLARLRHRRFFSLADLNAAIRALLHDLNDRPMRGWGTSRRALYDDQLDQPALEPLPAEPYEYAEWKRCRVNLDYHVEIAKHYYSVPHQLIRQEVEARITVATVEIFHRGKRVASHRRSARPHRPTTVPEHMPSAHRRYRDWTHERIRWRGQPGRRQHRHPGRCGSCARGRTRSRGSAPASASSAWSNATAPRASTPACARALGARHVMRSYNSVATILEEPSRDRTAAGIGEATILIHENIRVVPATTTDPGH